MLSTFNLYWTFNVIKKNCEGPHGDQAKWNVLVFRWCRKKDEFATASGD